MSDCKVIGLEKQTKRVPSTLIRIIGEQHSKPGLPNSWFASVRGTRFAILGKAEIKDSKIQPAHHQDVSHPS